MKTELQHSTTLSPEQYSPPFGNVPLSAAFLVDCLVGMSNYPDGYFEWAICDIPYGIGVGRMAYLSEVNTSVKQKNGTRLNPNKTKSKYTLKDWDKEPPTQMYFDELKRISKNQIIFGIEYVNWTGVGTGRIKWDKCFSEGVSFKRHEVAYCSSIDYTYELPLLWAGMCQAKSLSEPTTQQGNKKLNEKRIHPCHKPLLLYQALLKQFVKVGDKIVDTHLGGGSIRIAAKQYGCPFVGFEIDEEYFYKQEKRFRNYSSQLRCAF